MGGERGRGTSDGVGVFSVVGTSGGTLDFESRDSGGGIVVPVCARLESELSELEEADRAELLESVDIVPGADWVSRFDW